MEQQAWRNRVIEVRMMSLAECVPSEENWRTHPAGQHSAFRGMLGEIDYAGAALGRLLDDGRVQLIDGHMRREDAPDVVGPVVITDLTEAEAKKLLAVYTVAKAGARGKFTLERVNQIVALLEQGNSDADTCALVGISKQTFYEWQRTKADFGETVQHAKAQAHRAAVAAWRQGMLPTTTTSDSTETFAETRINPKDGKTYTYTRTKVIKQATNHPADWRAAAEYLKRRDPLNWSEMIRQLNFNRDITELSDEEVLALAEGRQP